MDNALMPHSLIQDDFDIQLMLFLPPYLGHIKGQVPITLISNIAWGVILQTCCKDENIN